MAESIFDFFTREAGQKRRRALDNAVGGLLEYLTPPNLRPAAEFAAQVNPIQGMSDSMAASGVVFDPEQTAEARKRAALDMGMEMAFALTPAALAARGYLTPVQGVMEGLLGGSPAQKVITDDIVERFTQPGEVPVMGMNFANSPSLYPYNQDGSLQQVEMYSPTLRAAENLKQNKGTYEQMKAMMLKSGAKEDEFEWSGANDQFAGSDVTKEGLINYLQRFNPKLEIEKNQAFGKTGGENFELDDYEIIDQAMEDRAMVSESRNNWVDYLLQEAFEPNVYQNAYFYVNDIEGENIKKLAKALNKTPDQIYDNYEYVYLPNAENKNSFDFLEQEFDPDDAELFSYGEEALAHSYGGNAKFEEELNSLIRGGLENDLSIDRPRFLQDYRVELEPETDAGDTEFMSYFPEEGENYTENLFRFRDPLDEIEQDNLPEASHFSDPEGLLLHTRQADFKSIDGEDVRYIGEIQSDVAQRLQKRNRRDQEIIKDAQYNTDEYFDRPEPTRQGLLNKQEQLKEAQKNYELFQGTGLETPQFPSSFDYDAKLVAPFMTENKFVDQAIRNSFFDAIKDNMPIVAFPADESAIGDVGGTSSPAQGAIDFYRKNVQNRLKAFLKKYNKDAKPEIIKIKRDKFKTNFDAFGVRITPELKEAIIKKGLPTYGVGATGILGYGATQEEKEKQGLLGI